MGTRGTCPPPPPPQFFQRTKSALFVMKSALFVQANVAVNTKLTSKVPFLFGHFDVFRTNVVENVQFRYGMTGTPPPRFRCPFQYPKMPPGSRCPPPNLLMLPTPLFSRIMLYYIYECGLVYKMPKSARFHIDRAEIIILPQKVATTVCFIQEESYSSKRNHVSSKMNHICHLMHDSSWMKQTVVATFCGKAIIYIYLSLIY